MVVLAFLLLDPPGIDSAVAAMAAACNDWVSLCELF